MGRDARHRLSRHMHAPCSAVLLLPITLLIASGCAPLLPAPPSEAVRTTFGTVAVVAAPFPPELEVTVTAKGRPAGAAQGAALGALAPLAAGSATGDPLFTLLMIALMPVGATVGAIAGAAHAEPAATVEAAKAAEAATRGTFDAIQIQDHMQSRVVEAITRVTAQRLIAPPVRGPSVLGATVPGALLPQDGVDTVLEVAVLKAGLVGLRFGVNPDLSVEMAVRARVFRPEQRTAIYEVTVISKHLPGVQIQSLPGGRWRTLSEWANDAQALRQEVTRTMDDLAEKIVDQVFLVYRPQR